MNEHKQRKADREHGNESPWIYVVILVIVYISDRF